MVDQFARTGHRICRICHRSLQERVRYHGDDLVASTYEHNAYDGPYDHEPEPVESLYADQVSVCDFCGAPAPCWEYPATSFAVTGEVAPGVGQRLTFASVDNWYACDECRQSNTSEDWEAIWRRWIAYHLAAFMGMSPAETRYLRAHMRSVYEGFLAHRQGECWDLSLSRD